jgi:hypothetical protein
MTKSSTPQLSELFMLLKVVQIEQRVEPKRA